jgi:hypothetical protein
VIAGLVILGLVAGLAFAVGRSTGKAAGPIASPTSARPPTSHLSAATIPVTSITTPTSTPTTVATNSSSPVADYYAAISAHDYRRAWQLGGSNLVGSYAAFAAGFANTDHEEMMLTASVGNEVDVQVTAYEYSSGGAQQTSVYAGSYQVNGGVITSGQLRLLSRTPGW